MRYLASLPLVLLLAAFSARAQDALPTIEEKTDGLDRRDGYFPLYWDDDRGVVWLEVPHVGEDFLYAVSLAAGLGSNDIGLDRNQLGPQRLVRFERVGRRLLMRAPNLRFRATTYNAMERRAVEDAFASSVVWGFDVAARTGDRFLVDATSFIVRDAHDTIARLRGSGQGTFRLDAARSVPNPDVLKAFPRNTEMEAWITLTSDSPGRYVRDVAADPGVVTLRVRHSLVRLPDPGFEPRAFHPASGYYPTTFADYAVPIGEDITQRFITRHRLQKADPAAAVSDPVEPIVYYLDPGTPEPVRSALLEGARWWDMAFQAAGFRNAFRVEVLPDSADALDARYNMINWVHRATRGWSYGSSLTDPRTGEIIKGHVLLGSLRVRQDYLLMEGLLQPYDASGDPQPDLDPMLRTALARIRQLSAHEVGHTLGLTHNFAASVNDRASVMDYPAPLVTIGADGQVEIDSAYDMGIGAWDVVTIRYGYTQFPDSVDEESALRAIVGDARDRGLHFLADQDARSPGSAHPLAHLWDNGRDAVDWLDHAMTIRQSALGRLGAASVRHYRPLAQLQEVLVPVYLHHRYQATAASKLVGGVSYQYLLNGEPGEFPSPVAVADQVRALDALLRTLEPEALAMPPMLRNGIPPRPPGYGATRELFDGYSDPVFDAYAPAEVATALVVDLLLNPQRTARLVYQADQDNSLPSLSDVLVRVTERLWPDDVPDDDYMAELQRITQQVWVDGLIAAAARPGSAPGVRSRLRQHLLDLTDYLIERPGDDFETTAHRSAVVDQLERYLFRLYDPDDRVVRSETPPGDPIGSGEAELHRHQVRLSRLDAWQPAHAWCSHGG